MFTIPSLPKLILLIVIIYAVWRGFRFLGAVEKVRQRSDSTPRPAQEKRRADVANVEDTLKCRVCGAYVPARQPGRCNRADCPF